MSNDRAEYDNIQKQINTRTNESLESTRRMVGLVSEAQEVGVNTMVMLDEQDEKLNRIEVHNMSLRFLLKFRILGWSR